MPANLVNEQELNQFLTAYICGYNSDAGISKMVLLSRKYLAEHTDDFAKAIAAQWMKSKFRDYLTQNETEVYLEPVTEAGADSAQWLKDALAAGRRVFRFCPDRVPLNKIGELQLIGRFAEMAAKDYVLRQAKGTSCRIRLDYLKTHGAFTSIEKVWAAYNRAKKERELNRGIEVVAEFERGFKMVQLQSREAFVLEGNAMGHCVGYEDYFERYQNGKIKIYSLRDERFRPHATIEVAGDTVVQVKGRADMNLHIDYIGYVQDFVKNNSLKVAPGEQLGIGILEKDNLYYNLYDLPKYRKFEVKDLDVSESGLRRLPDWKNLKVSGTLDLSTTKIKNLKGCAGAKRLRLYDCDELAADCLKDLPEDVEVLEDFKFGVEALQYLPEKNNLRRVEFQEDDQKHDLAALHKLPFRLLERLEFVNVSPQFKEERNAVLNSYETFGRLTSDVNVKNVG